MIEDLGFVDYDGVHPNKELWHLEEIAEDTRLSPEEKRALLAAWASDDRAVIGDPTLRQLPNGAVVTLASILDVLRKLDKDADRGRTALLNAAAARSGRRDRLLTKWRRNSSLRQRRRDGTDDDPPPSPASLRMPHPQPSYA